MTASSIEPTQATSPESASLAEPVSTDLPTDEWDEWAAGLVAEAARILRDVSGHYASFTDPATLIAVHSLNGAAKALETGSAEANFLSMMFGLVAARHLLQTNAWLYCDLAKRSLVPFDDGLREAYDQAIQGLGAIVDAFGSDESDVLSVAQDSDTRMTKGA